MKSHYSTCLHHFCFEEADLFIMFIMMGVSPMVPMSLGTFQSVRTLGVVSHIQVT